MALPLIIIAATNFSPKANNAVVYAAEFAKVLGAKLILTNSFFFLEDGAQSLKSDDLAQNELVKATGRLEHLGKDLSKIFNIVVEFFCDYSLLEEQLFFLTKDIKVEFIVMWMSDRSFDEDLKDDSMVSFIKKIKIPVLSVPERARFRNAKKILFAFNDLSLSSVEKLFWFTQITDDLQAEIEFFSIDEKVEELIQVQDKLNTADRDGFQPVKFVYKSIKASTLVNEIKLEIKTYNADILILVLKKDGFWDSLVHISKTKNMVAGLDIPLLYLPDF